MPPLEVHQMHMNTTHSSIGKQGGKLAESLEILMSLERLCRVGNDFTNLKEVILAATRMCREVGDWAQLNTTLTLLSKRRGQHGKTVTAMVQEVSRDAKHCSALANYGADIKCQRKDHGSRD